MFPEREREGGSSVLRISVFREAQSTLRLGYDKEIELTLKNSLLGMELICHLQNYARETLLN